MRIVSLLASATEIVCALGAGEMLVGRSHECDNPDWVRRLPSCSDPTFDVSVSSGEIDKEVRRRLHAGEPLYHVHGDLIRDLQSDLLITQSHCEVCAVTPSDVQRSCGHAARQLALSATTLEDIFESILRISRELGLEERGAEVVRRERQRLQAVREKTAHFRRPTVVMLEWTEYSSTVPAEQLRDADPEWLIVAPCGFNLERSLKEQVVLERYPWWRELQAVRNGKVAFADGNLFFNRSGMTVSETAEIIAEILHGVSFNGNTGGKRWRRIETPAARDSGRVTASQT
jgi:iron complex transport system substrate-binding protein